LPFYSTDIQHLEILFDTGKKYVKIYSKLKKEIKMAEKNILDILKGAILLEHRGKALYDSVVKTTTAESVRELFHFLADEENKHISLLEKQYKQIMGNKGFMLGDSVDIESYLSHPVMTEEVINEISGAGYEASVIAAALDFEKNAVKYYSDCAASAKSDEERKLYQWLANWEKTHMTMLAEVDEELKNKIWADNSFWPLD
jgi:rubrerythrin